MPSVKHPASQIRMINDAQVIDAALSAAEGRLRLYQHLLKVIIGVGLFGSSSIMVLAPVLVDPQIAAEATISADALVLGNSATFCGWAVGSVVAGGLSDKFGRKLVVVASGFLGSIGVLSSAFALNGATLVAGRALAGLSLGGTVGQGYVLAYESLSRARSAALSTDLNILWVWTVALIALLHAQALPWRIEQAALGAFVGIAALLLSALAVESPTYLTLSGRRDKALAAISRIGAISNAGQELAELKPTLAMWSKQGASTSIGKSLTAADDFIGEVRSELLGPRLKRSTISMCFAYLSLTFGYYAISFSAGALSDALLFNFVCLAALDVPGYMLAAKLVARYGALLSAFAGLGSTGILLLGTAALAQLHISPALVTAAAFTAKLAAATTFCVLYDLPVQLFPERVRGSATGLAQSSAHFGGLLSPLVVAYLPLAVANSLCSAMCLAAAFTLSLMLWPRSRAAWGAYAKLTSLTASGSSRNWPNVRWPWRRA